MPELPEVETTLRGVAPHVVGKRIAEVIVRDRRLRWPVPKEIHQVEGCRVNSAARRAKYLLLHTEAGTILMHLGMSGSLRVAERDGEWRKHDHFAIRLGDGRELRFHDPRRFGALLLTSNPEDHPLLRDLGPEPLGADFNAAYLRDSAKGRKTSIKQHIMNAQVVAGVGNIYACEALFMAGIRPDRPAGKLALARLQGLVAAIQKVLKASIERGGTTLRDFLHGRGEPGYFAQSLRVYDREGLPCPRCGAKIKRSVQGQRSTFHCPRCQK